MFNKYKSISSNNKYTFTCTKRGETPCKFNILYWPIDTTTIGLPISKEDYRRKYLQNVANRLHSSPEERSYLPVAQFPAQSNLIKAQYLDIIRSTTHRPTNSFLRNLNQIYMNTFHPWIAGVLNSNMDLQFIPDEYSCTSYVVEYVNKSA